MVVLSLEARPLKKLATKVNHNLVNVLGFIGMVQGKFIRKPYIFHDFPIEYGAFLYIFPQTSDHQVVSVQGRGYWAWNRAGVCWIRHLLRANFRLGCTLQKF